MKASILVFLLAAHAALAQEPQIESSTTDRDLKEFQEFQEFKKWKESQKAVEASEPKVEPITEQAPIPAPQVPSAPQPQVPQEKPWRFSIGVGFMLSTGEVELQNARVYDSSGSYPVNGSGSVSKADSIVIEANKMKRRAWGFQGGARLEQDRRLESTTFSVNGQSFSSHENSKSQTTFFYANLLYRFDDFYIPFGLNFTQVRGDSEPPAGVVVRTEPELGSQAGVGFFLKEDISAELTGMLMSQKFRIRDNNKGLTLEGREELRSIVATIKIYF